ncbi:hypothetical protein HJC23_012842 [Cyclotella cryptica]|uniref:Sugar phosphate transporter domain-containing protein n=1 Tax=Cyclotella cryptica TaxID=29204 RepID=A0ABD3Q1Q8_9STRA|eukprot:CCRYP_009403-RA/>CCRYP_009403-RA protein AED:0.00 eAED:0.00 QI:66/-1/1/1/-1/1/1/1835/593
MATSTESIHHRSRSKFPLPPPIQHNEHGHTGVKGSVTSNGTRPPLSLPLPPRRFDTKDSGLSSVNSGGSVHSNGVNSGATDLSVTSNLIAPTAVVPGRPRRRPHPKPAHISNAVVRHRPPLSDCHDDTPCTKEHSPSHSYNLPVPVAVLLWYLLGVVSIASTKVLLSTHHVPPLLLTLQQLVIGVTLLRTLLALGNTAKHGGVDECIENILGVERTRGGLQPIPMQSSSVVIDGSCPSGELCEMGQPLKRKSSNTVIDAYTELGVIYSILAIIPAKFQQKNGSSASIKGLQNSQVQPHIDIQLLLSAIYFTLGFLFTNYGFQSGSAAFVETIKAAEPITSASAAVAWGIERLDQKEVLSLAGIVVGVILSTIGQQGSKLPAQDPHSHSSVLKFVVVMVANLCFSFRGLHQKLFRATPQGKASSFDDLNLQFRMQQIGILVLVVPAILANALWILRRPTLFYFGVHLRYISLAIANGVAFTSYNLASTYVLTRISVVHHAALNCIRRVFAIVVTSIVFGLSITALQVAGIATSVGGFFTFSHYKLKRGIKEKKRKDLRKKYGLASSTKSGPKWQNGLHKSIPWADEKKETDSAV